MKPRTQDLVIIAVFVVFLVVGLIAGVFREGKIWGWW